MDRKQWIGVLARAPAVALDQLWQALGLAPAYQWLRPPEMGALLVTAMCRGRTPLWRIGCAPGC